MAGCREKQSREYSATPLLQSFILRISWDPSDYREMVYPSEMPMAFSACINNVVCTYPKDWAILVLVVFVFPPHLPRAIHFLFFYIDTYEGLFFAGHVFFNGII